MASESETVEDVASYYRAIWQGCEGVKLDNYEGKDILGLVDRFESAWRREKAKIEADALSVGAFVGATNVRRQRNCDRFASYKEAWKEFQKLHENDVPVVAEMLQWLFAPVAEGGEK